MRVLVVDDSGVGRKLLCGVLKKNCGIDDIAQAEDGDQALDAIKREDFALIFLDWEMPKMQGIDVLRAIRDAGNETPVMMVTGTSDSAHVIEAFEAGVNSYVTKPFKPEELSEKVEKLFEGFLHPSAEPKTIRVLVADDSSVIRRIIYGALQHGCGIHEIVQAADGREALDTIKKQDFSLVLLDWNMPEMAGIDVLRAIRSMGKKTPVIMVTSEVEKARVIEALEAGANDYVVKPFGPKSLEKKVRKTLDLRF